MDQWRRITSGLFLLSFGGVLSLVIARHVVPKESQWCWDIRNAMVGLLHSACNDSVVCPLPVIPNLFRILMIGMLKRVQHDNG